MNKIICKMFFMFVSLVLLLQLTSKAHAQRYILEYPCFEQDNTGQFCGIYGGLSLGGAFINASGTTSTNVNAFFTPSGNSDFHLANTTFNVKKTAPMLMLSAGQGWQICDQIFLGYELFASYAKFNRGIPNISNNTSYSVGIMNNVLSNQANIKLKTISYGLDFRPGFVSCENTLLYARLGVLYQNTVVNSNPVYAFSRISERILDVGSAALSSEKRRNRFAWRLGLGIEQKFNECLSLRMDYALSYFGRTETSGGVSVANANAAIGMVDNTSATLLSNAITVGVFYWW